MKPNGKSCLVCRYTYDRQTCSNMRSPRLFLVPFKIVLPPQYDRWKLKCTLVQALRLSTGRTAHRGRKGISLPFHDHGTWREWGVSVTPRPLFTPGKDPVPFVQEAGWAPGPIWTGAENLAKTGIRSPDRPAHSQSLYRLRYSAHSTIISPSLINIFFYWHTTEKKPSLKRGSLNI